MIAYDSRTVLLANKEGNHFSVNLPSEGTLVETTNTHCVKTTFTNGTSLLTLHEIGSSQSQPFVNEATASVPLVDESLFSRSYGFGPGFFIPIVIMNILEKGSEDILIDATDGSSANQLLEMVNDLFTLGIVSSIVNRDGRYSILVHKPEEFHKLCAFSFPSINYSFVRECNEYTIPSLEIESVETVPIEEGQEFYTLDPDTEVFFCGVQLWEQYTE